MRKRRYNKQLWAVMSVAMIASPLLIPKMSFADELHDDSFEKQIATNDIFLADSNSVDQETEENNSEESAKVKIHLEAQKDGQFLFVPGEYEVPGDIAEKYGYQDNITGVSLMDVMVFAHEKYYGSDFTKDNCEDYLKVEETTVYKATVTKMFGHDNGGVEWAGEYAVNGVVPNNGGYPCGGGVETYPAYSSRINDKDVVQLFTLDHATGQDMYSWFMQEDEVADSLALEPGKEAEVQIKGVCYRFSIGVNMASASKLKESGQTISGASIGIYDPETNKVTEKWTTDSDGKANISFDSAGTYYVTPCGKDSEGKPVKLALTKVEVSSLDDQTKPTSIKIETDDSAIVSRPMYSGSSYYYNYYVMTPGGSNVLNLRAVDENGNETPVRWSSSGMNLEFASPTNGKASVSNDSTSSKTITITARSRLDGSITARYEIRILPPILFSATEDHPVYELEFDKNGAKKAASKRIDVFPSDYASWGKLLWELEDDSIVSLEGQDTQSNRTATPLKPGTTELTVRDKSNKDHYKTATIHVKGIAVEDEAGKTEKTTTWIGNDVTLKAITEDENAKIKWSSEDESIATVDSYGNVRPRKTGTVVIHATDLDGNVGGITVNVKESEKSAVLRNLILSSPSDYYGNEDFSTDSRLTSSQGYEDGYYNSAYLLTGHWYETFSGVDEKYYVKESLGQMRFYPMFDDDVKVEVYQDGELKETPALGTQVALSLHSLKNEVVIRAVSKEDPSIYTDYKIEVDKERSSAATLSGVNVSPDGRELYSNVQILNNAEGTLFQIDASSGDLKQSYGRYSTGLSSSYSPVFDYKSFLFGDVEEFTTTITASDDSGTHIRYAIDGTNDYKEGKGVLKTDKISFEGGKNSVKINVEVVSEKAYATAEAAGGDPWSQPTEYSFEIARLDIKAEDVAVEKFDITTDGVTIYSPGFKKDVKDVQGIVNADVNAVGIDVTVLKDNILYYGTSSYNLLTDANKKSPKEGAETEYSIEARTTSTYSNSSYLVAAIYANVPGVDGQQLITRQYDLSFAKKAADNDTTGVADSVYDFISVGSKNTNNSSNSYYKGLYPEQTLKSNPTMQSAETGLFGGYITYYYKDAITNDKTNKYGIDFTVFGKQQGYLPEKISSVWVSEDGKTWYELAGSEHYDDNAIWNYNVKYSDANGTAEFTDSQGRSGATGGNYPKKELYPLYNGDMSFSGTLLLGGNGLDFSKAGASAPVNKWGYVAMLQIVPSDAYDSAIFDTKPIGTGAYKVTEYTTNQQIILEANKDCFTGAPDIDKITLVYMDQDAAIAAANSGQLDIVMVSPSYANESIDGMTIQNFTTMDVRQISLPTIAEQDMTDSEGNARKVGNNITSDAAVRKALAIGIDRQNIINNGLNGVGKPAKSFVNLTWSLDENYSDGQVDEAKKVLEDGGWKDSDGDGFVEKDGKICEFDIIAPGNDMDRYNLAMALAEDAKNLGIKINVQNLSWDEAGEKTNTTPIVWGWGQYNPMVIDSLLDSEMFLQGAYDNVVGYKNSTTDAAIANAIKSKSNSEAISYWKEAQKAAVEDYPYLYLVNIEHSYFINNNLNISKSTQIMHPHGHGSPIVCNIADWSWK